MADGSTTAPMTALVAVTASGLALVLAMRLLTVERRARRLAARLVQADRAARTDPLTGLANRNGLVRAFAELSAAAPGEYMALVLLDLDQLKPINDTHGHDAGDQVIREVARRIAQPAPEVACAARMGGDEFVVLLSPGDYADAERRATAFAAMVCARIRLPITVPATEVAISTSAGIAVLPTTRLDQLLTAADRAMYRAKHSRTGTVHYRPDLDGPTDTPYPRTPPDVKVNFLARS